MQVTNSTRMYESQKKKYQKTMFVRNMFKGIMYVSGFVSGVLVMVASCSLDAEGIAFRYFVEYPLLIAVVWAVSCLAAYVFVGKYDKKLKQQRRYLQYYRCYSNNTDAGRKSA